MMFRQIAPLFALVVLACTPPAQSSGEQAAGESAATTAPQETPAPDTGRPALPPADVAAANAAAAAGDRYAGRWTWTTADRDMALNVTNTLSGVAIISPAGEPGHYAVSITTRDSLQRDDQPEDIITSTQTCTAEPVQSGARLGIECRLVSASAPDYVPESHVVQSVGADNMIGTLQDSGMAGTMWTRQD